MKTLFWFTVGMILLGSFIFVCIFILASIGTFLDTIPMIGPLLGAIVVALGLYGLHWLIAKIDPTPPTRY